MTTTTKSAFYIALEPVLLKAVKDHAYENYEKGWDAIVECFSDEDIIAAFGWAETAKGAIRKIQKDIVDLRLEMASNCY